MKNEIIVKENENEHKENISIQSELENVMDEIKEGNSRLLVRLGEEFKKSHDLARSKTFENELEKRSF